MHSERCTGLHQVGSDSSTLKNSNSCRVHPAASLEGYAGGGYIACKRSFSPNLAEILFKSLLPRCAPPPPPGTTAANGLEGGLWVCGTASQGSRSQFVGTPGAPQPIESCCVRVACNQEGASPVPPPFPLGRTRSFFSGCRVVIIFVSRARFSWVLVLASR